MASTPAKQPMRSRYAESAESDLDKMLRAPAASKAPQSAAGAGSAAGTAGVAVPSHPVVSSVHLGDTLPLDMLSTPPAPQNHRGGGFGPARTNTSLSAAEATPRGYIHIVVTAGVEHVFTHCIVSFGRQDEGELGLCV